MEGASVWAVMPPGTSPAASSYAQRRSRAAHVTAKAASDRLAFRTCPSCWSSSVVATCGRARRALGPAPGSTTRACTSSWALSDTRRQRNHVQKTVGELYAGKPHVQIERRMGNRASDGTAPLTTNGRFGLPVHPVNSAATRGLSPGLMSVRVLQADTRFLAVVTGQNERRRKSASMSSDQCPRMTRCRYRKLTG